MRKLDRVIIHFNDAGRHKPQELSIAARHTILVGGASDHQPETGVGQGRYHTRKRPCVYIKQLTGPSGGGAIAGNSDPGQLGAWDYMGRFRSHLKHTSLYIL